jgi:hypothetical protein
MTKTLTLSLTLLALGLVVLVGVLFNQAENVSGAGWTPVAQQFATSTVVGPRGTGVVREVIFPENAACKSRVITTPGTSAIMISFDDIPAAGILGSTTVSASLGFLQAASTTKEYDSAIYGCGVWNGWAWASTTLTVSEF